MCGIAGIFNTGSENQPVRHELEKMISRLQHRGPDGYGFYLQDQIGLAHSRLSIIDLEGGDQPIRNEDGKIRVIFNGEIYNYIELKADLQKRGHNFYTRSDTEVIVHLYEEHGEEFVNYLNGQFAIALWDENKKQLILARDRVGIRPIYFTAANNRIYFASEIKALFVNVDVRRQLDHSALGQLFTYWSVLPGKSVFRDISMVPPGHYLIINKKDRKLKKYWDWSFPTGTSPEARDIEECAEELRNLLVDSVRLRLRSDVPVGAYLSGGLDSSVITTLIKNYTDTPLRTFSLTFDDKEFDESSYQDELVGYLGTKHTKIHCTRKDICNMFPRTIWHTESPILRTAPTPMMLLSGLVREQGYKVVLTGEGSDEVLGGYDIFKEAKVRRFWARQKDSVMRPRILERLYPYLKHSPTASPAYAKSFFMQGMEHIDKPYFAHIPRWSTTSRIFQFLSKDLKEELAGWDPYKDIEQVLPDEINSWGPLNRDQYVEAHTLMSGYLLSSQGDRVASANSIEGRFPFLDHRVIEFANQLPARYKINGLNEKYILKQAMKDYLPENIGKRSKQPYRAPDSQSFFENGKAADYVSDLFSAERINKAGYFNSKAVGKLFNKCQSGRAIGFGDNMAFVGILSTMLVDEFFIQNNDFTGTG